MNRFLKAALCLGILVSAPFVLLQGLANARVSPALIAWNGFWQADLAGNFVTAEQNDERLELSVNPLGRELAISAFASEPFATDALFLTAVDLRTQGKTDEFDRLLELALGLDKRNRQLGVLELEKAAVEGDLPKTFAVIDRLGLTNPQVLSQFIIPMTALLDREDSLPVFSDALRNDPPWAPAFWNSMPQTPQGVINMYRLRESVDVGTSSETDQRLMAALGIHERYDLAIDFWDYLREDGASDDFAFLPSLEFQPIGWRPSDARGLTFRDLGEGEFEIFVEQQTSGELARQLLRLKPGEYRLKASASPVSGMQDIRAGLVCADSEQPLTDWQVLEERPRWQAAAGCEHYWLVLSASAWESRGGLRYVLSDMRIEQL